MSTINTNVTALNAARNLDRAQDLLNRSLERLSSGTKIASPGDDAAGLAVAGKLDAQNLRVSAASTNVQNAISYAQTSDGYLSGMGSVVTRLSELASLAQDPTKSPSDIANYQQEFSSLQDQLRSTIGGTTTEIGGTSDVTSPLGTFNGMELFGSTAAGGQTLTIGASGQEMTIPDTDLRTGNMLDLIGQNSSGQYNLSLTDPTALAKINGALQQVATSRATLGASESRLNLAATTLAVEGQNLASTISGIQDVDVASESTQYAKYNILVQSGTAMLAQANQSPQSVLKLLQTN
jgi:flagellin